MGYLVEFPILVLAFFATIINNSTVITLFQINWLNLEIISNQSNRKLTLPTIDFSPLRIKQLEQVRFKASQFTTAANGSSSATVPIFGK